MRNVIVCERNHAALENGRRTAEQPRFHGVKQKNQ
jgi:hypothetical protein